MYNPTELMLSILKSEEAQYIIDRISPIYGEARVFLWLLQAIGKGLDECESCKEDFDAQSLIATATWSLKNYEEQYGVTTDTSLSYEKRRENVYAAIRFKVPLNPKKMESILSMIGKTHIRIEENTGKNTFKVHSNSSGYLGKITEFLNVAKPAHTIYEFDIHDQLESEENMYAGFYAITIPETFVDFGGVS